MAGLVDFRTKYFLCLAGEWQDLGVAQLFLIDTGDISEKAILGVSYETESTVMSASRSEFNDSTVREDTILCWCDEGVDKALSFLSAEDCKKVVEFLEITVTFVSDDASIGIGASDSSEVSLTVGLNTEKEPELDAIPVTIESLGLWATRLVDYIVPISGENIISGTNIGKVSKLFQDENLLEDFITLFDKLESDNEADHLATLFSIFQTLILIDYPDILSVLLSESNIMKTIGILEYDVTRDERICHRDFLLYSTQYKKFFLFEDDQVSDNLSKIRADLYEKSVHVFRLQYLADKVMPPSTIFDDKNTTLNNMLNHYKADICNILYDNSNIVKVLMERLLNSDVLLTIDEKRDAVLFFSEFCFLSNSLYPTEKESFFKWLEEYRFMDVVDKLVGSTPNLKQLRKILEIIGLIVEQSPQNLRDFFTGQVATNKPETILHHLFNIISTYTNSYVGALSAAYITSLMEENDGFLIRPATGSFIHDMFTNCVHIILDPLIELTNDDFFESDTEQNAEKLEIYINIMAKFSVLLSSEEIFYQKLVEIELLRRLGLLLDTVHSSLTCSLIRFLRKLITKATSKVIQLVLDSEIFVLVMNIFYLVSNENTMVCSVILELINFICTENMSVFYPQIIDENREKLISVEYVPVFEQILVKHDAIVSRQNIACNVNTSLSIDSSRSNSQDKSVRIVDEAWHTEKTEDDWFETDSVSDDDLEKSISCMNEQEVDKYFDEVLVSISRKRPNLSAEDDALDNLKINGDIKKKNSAKIILKPKFNIPKTEIITKKNEDFRSVSKNKINGNGKDDLIAERKKKLGNSIVLRKSIDNLAPVNLSFDTDHVMPDEPIIVGCSSNTDHGMPDEPIIVGLSNNTDHGKRDKPIIVGCSSNTDHGMPDEPIFVGFSNNTDHGKRDKPIIVGCSSKTDHGMPDEPIVVGFSNNTMDEASHEPTVITFLNNADHGMTDQSTHITSTSLLDEISFEKNHGMTDQSTHITSTSLLAEISFDKNQEMTGSNTHFTSTSLLDEISFETNHGMTDQSTHITSIPPLAEISFEKNQGMTGSDAHFTSIPPLAEISFEKNQEMTGSNTHFTSIPPLAEIPFEKNQGMTGQSTHFTSIPPLAEIPFETNQGMAGQRTHITSTSPPAQIPFEMNQGMTGQSTHITSTSLLDEIPFETNQGMVVQSTHITSISPLTEIPFETIQGMTGSNAHFTSIPPLAEIPFKTNQGMTGLTVVDSSFNTTPENSVHNLNSDMNGQFSMKGNFEIAQRENNDTKSEPMCFYEEVENNMHENDTFQSKKCSMEDCIEIQDISARKSNTLEKELGVTLENTLDSDIVAGFMQKELSSTYVDKNTSNDCLMEVDSFTFPRVDLKTFVNIPVQLSKYCTDTQIDDEISESNLGTANVYDEIIDVEQFSCHSQSSVEETKDYDIMR